MKHATQKAVQIPVRSGICPHKRQTILNSGFTLIELMVVLIVVSAFAALVGPNIFKQIQQVKSVAEQKKLEFVLEHTKTIAFCRQSSFWVKMENNQLTVENSTGEAVKQIAFEFLHFNKEDVQFNANGFPSTSKIEYNRHGVPAVFWLQQ